MKNNKILYIHIGMAKTATSAIQNALSDNIEVLTECDTLYPVTGRFVDNSHHILAFSISPNEFYKDFIRDKELLLSELKTEIDSSKLSNVILSSECFSNLQHDSDFLSLFENYTIKVIVCIREAQEYFESWYRQWVKDPNVKLTSEFSEFFSTHKTLINIDKELLKWEHLIGKDNIQMLNFSIPQQRDNIVNLFFNKCGLSNVKVINNDIVNKSISYEGTKILRQVNDSKLNPKTRSKFLELCLGIEDVEKKTFFDERCKEEIEDIYSKRFRDMIERYK